MRPSIDIVPVEIRQVSDTELSISWSDAHQSIYDIKYLRAECPCALCRENRKTEQQKKTEKKGLVMLGVNVPQQYQILEITPVGRYALQFSWSDQHNSGIYTYEYLRSLCQCAQCKAARESA